MKYLYGSNYEYFFNKLTLNKWQNYTSPILKQALEFYAQRPVEKEKLCHLQLELNLLKSKSNTHKAKRARKKYKMEKSIFLIAAFSDNLVIGNKGKIPWHIPEDLKRFKRITACSAMIMGRKTFESLPGLLPGRDHIVLTRNEDWYHPGVIIAHTPEDALEKATFRRERVAIVGGADIYKEFAAHANKAYLTIVHGDYKGDAYFPTDILGDFDALLGVEPACDTEHATTYLTIAKSK